MQADDKQRSDKLDHARLVQHRVLGACLVALAAGVSLYLAYFTYSSPAWQAAFGYYLSSADILSLDESSGEVGADLIARAPPTAGALIELCRTFLILTVFTWIVTYLYPVRLYRWQSGEKEKYVHKHIRWVGWLLPRKLMISNRVVRLHHHLFYILISLSLFFGLFIYHFDTAPKKLAMEDVIWDTLCADDILWQQAGNYRGFR